MEDSGVTHNTAPPIRGEMKKAYGFIGFASLSGTNFSLVAAVSLAATRWGRWTSKDYILSTSLDMF